MLAYRLGNPGFEIKLIDFFASNVIKTPCIAHECIRLLFIYCLETNLAKNACLHIHFYSLAEVVSH